ncbi:hypothetical protein [Polynucleobacter sp. es-EL-1]|uniref:hypothetical protein n=1 Tax=Polynucleobacter sp. es-EL-1 TaxID=1855652 RepID=UPI001BFDB066|nr:hypothetical protein [Polynucleobacter sp. es-EL-1]QWE10888.1 hypothetical protein FD974_01720 [Polynucleobacter sp. es-EL-1]
MTMICIASCVNSEKKLIDSLRYFLLGGAFAALWGILHFLLHILDLEYPAFLFNNSIGVAALGYVSTLLDGTIPRVSSVATEPSYLVRSTIPMIVILYIFWNFRFHLTSRAATYFYLIFLVVVTILSTSTLGFFGLFMLYLIFLFTARPSFIAKVLSIFVLAFAFMLLYSEPFYIVLNELVFEKFTIGSGGDRLNTVLIGVENFLESPFLGVGPGMLTVHDLFVKMYSNFGLFGATFYFAFIFFTLYSSYKIIIKIKLKSRKLYIFYLSILLANITLLLLDVVSGMSYTYGIFWVLLGLLMSLKNLDEYKKIKIV